MGVTKRLVQKYTGTPGCQPRDTREGSQRELLMPQGHCGEAVTGRDSLGKNMLILGAATEFR